MSDYQLTATVEVIRKSDAACIPNDPANRDYAEYQVWLKAGGVPDPYVKPQADIDSETRKAAFDADATRADLMTRLRSATPAQISSYVDANVTNIAEARALFKRILLVLAQ